MAYNSTRRSWIIRCSIFWLKNVRSVNNSCRTTIAPTPTAAVGNNRSRRPCPITTSMNCRVTVGNTNTSPMHTTAIATDPAACQR